MIAKLILVSIVGMATLGFSGSACGQYGIYGSPYSAVCWAYGYQTTYSIEQIPYFSLHPPVYYSYRIARTYGYSPFAYPPGVLTPDLQSSCSAVVQTVYESMDETSESQPQGQRPLRIDNPFVEQSGGPGVTDARKPAARRQPQVVYPAAMARRAD